MFSDPTESAAHTLPLPSGCCEHTAPKTASPVPDNETRAAIIRTIFESKQDRLYEHRSGSVRLHHGLGSMISSYCGALGECGDSGCGCYRLSHPRSRGDFQAMVIEKMAASYKTSYKPVRLVTLGSGQLLTDFHILAGLVHRGVAIEQVVAIDAAYPISRTDDDVFKSEYHEALSQLAAFFAPARVYSFSSSDDYAAAAKWRPDLYGRANCFVWCDAAAVPHASYEKAAKAALLPGCNAFELSNSGWLGAADGERSSQLEAYLPQHLRRKRVSSASSSMHCKLCVPPRPATLSMSLAEPVTYGGTEEARLDEQHDPRWATTSGGAAALSAHQVTAIQEDSSPRARSASPPTSTLPLAPAARTIWNMNARCMNARCDRWPVTVTADGGGASAAQGGREGARSRGGPSLLPRRLLAAHAAARAAVTSGDHRRLEEAGRRRVSTARAHARAGHSGVLGLCALRARCSSLAVDSLADEVSADGWVRLSDLDTYWGYERRHSGHDEQAWMLIRATDVGELLREIVLDADANDVESDEWLPELF